MATTYVVTGAAGFIGGNIVRELLQRGERVKGIDNFLTGKPENIADIRADMEFIESDVRDTEALKKHFKGATYILHQAALPSVPRSIDSPAAANDHNINGTLSVLLAARDTGVRRVVYASSSSIYGDAAVDVKTEDLPINPLSPYALTKYAGERYAQLFASFYKLETVCLRYFNVFGPRQDPLSQYAAVIPRFITAMLRDEAPVIHGDGAQSRDFTFVANNVSANLLACAASTANGEMMNIATGSSINLNELAASINKLLGKNIKPQYDAARPGDVKHSLASITKAARLIGYTVVTPFEQGLAQTIEWYQNKK